MGARPKRSEFGSYARPKVRGNDKYVWFDKQQRGQLCTLILRREKRKKKRKQSITDDNPTIIFLHALHHVEEGTTAHPVRRWMSRFGHQKVSYVPP